MTSSSTPDKDTGARNATTRSTCSSALALGSTSGSHTRHQTAPNLADDQVPSRPTRMTVGMQYVTGLLIRGLLLYGLTGGR